MVSVCGSKLQAARCDRPKWMDAAIGVAQINRLHIPARKSSQLPRRVLSADWCREPVHRMLLRVGGLWFLFGGGQSSKTGELLRLHRRDFFGGWAARLGKFRAGCSCWTTHLPQQEQRKISYIMIRSKLVFSLSIPYDYKSLTYTAANPYIDPLPNPNTTFHALLNPP